MRVVVDFTSLTPALGAALRCDIANISTASASAVQVVTYTLVSGTAFTVAANDPMNTATCAGGRRLRSDGAAAGSEPGPRALRPSDIASVNVTCTVPHHNASFVVAALTAAPPAAFVAVIALTVAQPALLGEGAPPGGGVHVTGTAVFLVSPSTSASAAATPTPSPTGTTSATTSAFPTATGSAIVFVIQSVTTSNGGALTPQGAAILAGTVVAFVVLFAGCVLLVLAWGRRPRKLVVGDRVATAA